MAAKKPKTDKEERLAAQLRANLARRKAQARGKRAGDGDQRPESPNGVSKDRAKNEKR